MSKAEQFKQEVKAICQRYDAKLHTGEYYDQNEEQCGDSYWIVVDGEHIELSELVDDE